MSSSEEELEEVGGSNFDDKFDTDWPLTDDKLLAFLKNKIPSDRRRLKAFIIFDKLYRDKKITILNCNDKVFNDSVFPMGLIELTKLFNLKLTDIKVTMSYLNWWIKVLIEDHKGKLEICFKDNNYNDNNQTFPDKQLELRSSKENIIHTEYVTSEVWALLENEIQKKDINETEKEYPSLFKFGSKTYLTAGIFNYCDHCKNSEDNKFCNITTESYVDGDGSLFQILVPIFTDDLDFEIFYGLSENDQMKNSEYINAIRLGDKEDKGVKINKKCIGYDNDKHEIKQNSVILSNYNSDDVLKTKSDLSNNNFIEIKGDCRISFDKITFYKSGNRKSIQLKLGEAVETFEALNKTNFELQQEINKYKSLIKPIEISSTNSSSSDSSSSKDSNLVKLLEKSSSNNNNDNNNDSINNSNIDNLSSNKKQKVADDDNDLNNYLEWIEKGLEKVEGSNDLN